jgi:Zn-dependent peptidase ImmA (M78 family)
MNTNNIQLTTEQASCFAQPAEVSNWIYAIENKVGPWVKEKGNKALWDVVLFASQRMGTIKKPLSRLKFASLLVALCPKALDASDTPTSIKASMEKSAFTKKQMADFDRLPDTHALRLLVNEIEQLLNSDEDYEAPIEPEFTLRNRLEDYLRGTVDEQKEKMPCSVIVGHPVYGNITPTLSIETFQTAKFMEAKTPSHVVAYECVDGIVDRDKIYSLVGQYNKMQGVKLWVVSTSGFRNDVVSVARENFVGLMRIDLNTGVNSDSFILPRSVEDHVKYQQGVETMMGRRFMEYPLLSWKGNTVTSSMAEILAADGVRIKEGLLLKSPIIYNEEIEELADELTDKLPSWDLLPVNLDRIIRYCELTWQWGDLPAEQLGIIELSNDLVTINRSLRFDEHRKRFTLAHELGHHLLHKELLERNRLTSFGETMITLANTTPVSGDELSWLEHHANHFAACILMPRKTVIEQYKRYYDYHIIGVYGSLLAPLNWDEDNWFAMQKCMSVIGPLSRRFGVSIEAMKWRLKSLGWLRIG